MDRFKIIEKLFLTLKKIICNLTTVTNNRRDFRHFLFFKLYRKGLKNWIWAVAKGLTVGSYRNVAHIEKIRASCNRPNSNFSAHFDIFRYKTLFLVVFLFAKLFLWADSKRPPVPPGGIIERQIQQEYEAKEVEAKKQIPILEVDDQEKEFEMEGDKMVVHCVKLLGNTVIPSSRLQPVIDPFLHREIDMREIRKLCLTIQEEYAKEGYFLSRAYAPAQEVQDHTLTIEIVEGKLGKISVIGNQHYSKKFVSQHFEKYQNLPIHYDQILKALLLLDENSDLDVGAIFKKGSSYGTADLIIRVTDARPFHFSIDHNNYGSDYTSPHRTGATLNWGNLIMNGDMCTLIEVVGSPIENLDFTEAIYDFPINSYGSSFTFSFLYSNSKTAKVDSNRYKGISRIATAKFSQALHRTRVLNTDFITAFDYKQIQNFGGGVETSFDKLRVLTGGIDIDYIDSLMGRNLITTTLGWGIPNILGGNRPISPGDSRVDGGGRFFVLKGSWRRLQKIPYDCFAILNGVFQLGFNKLPLPEQIYIGGINTVRGYKLAVGLGDSGFYANAELRLPPPFLRSYRLPWSKKTWGEFIQFVGFVDYGQTFSLGRNILRELGIQIGNEKEKTVPYAHRTILTSAGCGARLYGPWHFEWSVDIGFPLTDHDRSSNTIVYFKVEWKVI